MDYADQSEEQGAVSQPATVGIPRRFGLRELLGLTTLFSVIFFIGQAVELPRPAVVGVGVFFVIVGMIQWMIGEGPRARRVSIITGGVSLPLIAFVGLYANAMANGEAPSTLIMQIDYVAAIVAIPILCFLGAVSGYGAGTLVAGVFLLAHWPDNLIKRRLHREPDATFDSIASDD